MSKILVQQYLSEIDKLIKFSGTTTEQVIREAFKDLLKTWAKGAELFFVPELVYDTSMKTKVYPDGTILHDLRVPLGFWEAKDTHDDLDVEIAKKLKKGYPQDNIIFENSDIAVLWQDRGEVMRCDMNDTDALEKLLNLFFGYERAEIYNFRKAVEQFKQDLPHVLDALRKKINAAYETNVDFKTAANEFLAHAKDTINPTIGEADVREMLIQHILTEEIFAHVFNEGDFHRDNNIAKKLYALEAKFFTGALKKQTLASLESYYAAIRSAAVLVTSHNEKQAFLKVIYENFYKIYNPKAADRLGVVYTPNEVVRFMIEGADWLCQKHFGKSLIDENVDILDPATGTGTFICELMEYFRGQPEKLAHKYKNELHANEVAILPYYVANLNIEASYAAISGQFSEFNNLCFVDTLDNVAGLNSTTKDTYYGDLLGGLSDENIERINRQNARKISVIIGNPPYNANQANENDNNKNREYKHIDALIKASYIKRSTAQKTKLYDMYARFFRWASDRLPEDGVLAFITNRSFIEARTFDGFRKIVADEYADIYVIDLGGDVRANPKLSGTKNNVFGIQTGVAISFMVKRKGAKESKIYYARRPEFDTAEDKLAFLSSTLASEIKFKRIEPDKNGNWINLPKHNWDHLIPVADKATKANKIEGQNRAIFKLFSLGAVTNRDDWVFDENRSALVTKVKLLIDLYEADRKTWRLGTSNKNIANFVNRKIKWTGELESHIKRNTKLVFDSTRLRTTHYRPFHKRKNYYTNVITHRIYQNDFIFPIAGKWDNKVISYNRNGNPFSVLSSDILVDLHFTGDAVELPRYRHIEDGRIDNITDWGLGQFVAHYGKDTNISKDDIFHYVYAVLHDPVYREKYALNLKREFPRIPFYPKFNKWAKWGKKLMKLHIGYEKVEPWPLERTDMVDERAKAAGLSPKVFLKADKDIGNIKLDSETQLSGIPPEVWDYKLGNRSALEWILDQYKEKKPRDPTIREKFNTYRFADYKEHVIDLLLCVTRVSVETQEITEAMRAAKRKDVKL